MTRVGVITSASEKGSRPQQEDRVVAQRLQSPIGEIALLAALDGHGGDAVSESSALALPDIVSVALSDSRSLMAAAERSVAELAVGAASYRDIGTTISLVLISGADLECCVAVLGDSPVVVRAQGGELYGSARHHVVNESEREAAVTRGGAVAGNGFLCNAAEDGTADLERGAIVLSRALGSRRFEFLETTPEIASLPLSRSSFVLVATDGLLVVDDRWQPDDFAAFVAMHVDEGWRAPEFVMEAQSISQRDNASAVLWTVQE